MRRKRQRAWPGRPGRGQRLALACWILVWWGNAWRAGAADEGGKEAVMREVFGIFQKNCFKCHTEEKRKGELAMDTREALIAGGETGAAVVPGKAEESYLVELLFPDADGHMPPKGQLDAKEIAAVEGWIDAGAPWDGKVWEEMRTARRREAVAVGELPARYQPSWAVALSPDGKLLAAGMGSAVEIFDVGGMPGEGFVEPVRVLDGRGDAVQSLAWSRDGKLLAAGGFRRIAVWEAEGFAELKVREEGLGGRITALEFTADGKEVIAADSVPSAPSQIHWWEWSGGGMRTVDGAHEDTVFDMEVSGDGKYLASAGADRVVRLREAGSGKIRGTLEGHTGYVLALAFSPESGRLATAGDDAVVKVWELGSLKRVSSFGENGDKTGPITGLGWMVDAENAKRKAEEKDATKAEAINVDRIVAVNEKGQPNAYRDIVVHEGEQSSAGAKEVAMEASGKQLSGVALDEGSGRLYAGTVEGELVTWDAGGKKRVIRGAPEANR